MRVLLAALILGAAVAFAPAILTKENLVVLIVGLLTLIALVRVLLHETHEAAKDIGPSLTEIVEGYYKFRLRLLSLEAEFQRARLSHPRCLAAGESAGEYHPANRSG